MQGIGKVTSLSVVSLKTIQYIYLRTCIVTLKRIGNSLESTLGVLVGRSQVLEGRRLGVGLLQVSCSLQL